MTDKLFNTIIQTTHTRVDAFRRLRLLREFLQQKFFLSEEEKSIKNFLVKKGESAEEIVIITKWFTQISDQVTPKNYSKILNNIIKDIKNLPNITIYISFILSRSQKEKLSLWLRQNVHPQVMLDIQLDPDTIGGCALVWKGTYQDFSLRRLFEQKKQNILKTISKVIKKQQA